MPVATGICYFQAIPIFAAAQHVVQQFRVLLVFPVDGAAIFFAALSMEVGIAIGCQLLLLHELACGVCSTSGHKHPGRLFRLTSNRSFRGSKCKEALVDVEHLHQSRYPFQF